MDALAKAKKMTVEEMAEFILKAEAERLKFEAQEQESQKLKEKVAILQYKLRYLSNLAYGASSEKRALQNSENPDQVLMDLDVLEVPEEPPPATVSVAAYEKRARKKPSSVQGEKSRGLQFDERALHIEIVVEAYLKTLEQQVALFSES